MGSRNRNPLIIDAFQVRFLIFSYVNIVLTFFITGQSGLIFSPSQAGEETEGSLREHRS